MKHIFTTCLFLLALLHTINIQAQPDPCENFAANFGFDSEFAGLNVQFVNSSTGDIGAVLWTFGDGTSSDNYSPLHEYPEPGTYQICLHISNEWCSSETCKWVVIGEAPAACAAHFNFETEGLTAWFNGNPSEANGEITNYFWTYGDGTTSGEVEGPQVVHTYAEAGTYVACLTITTANGCTDDICHEVTIGDVPPACAAHFNFETEGLTAWFNGNPSEANGDIIGWQWNFGDGTSSGPDAGATVNHTYAEAGTYTVCLLIWTGNGCEDDICQTVTVSGGVTPTCAAHFNFETEGLTAWFNGNPSEANGEIIGWHWSFGDGTSSGDGAGATVNHTYAEAGTYTVCLHIWTADCEDSICQTVTVSGGTTPTCAAHFNFETEGLTAWFNGNPSEANGEIIGWHWSFGDGTSSGDGAGATVNHTYAEAGTYTVCLLIWTGNGCEDDICQTVTVSGGVTPTCAAHFNFETEGLTAWFNGNPSEANGDIIGWQWNFGDGTSSGPDAGATVNHTYAEAGTYTVCLLIWTGNGCEDDICQTVTVSGGVTPTCAAHFNFETEGLTAWFNGNPSEANGDIIGWQWNFGDGTSSGPDAGATVNHTYAEAGTYTVCLLIWTGNGCEDDICQTVTVSGGTTPTCAAHFNFETEGLTAWFNGNPSEANGDIIGWQWNFGDGTSSGPDAGATVNHTYAEAGTYTVCLLIWTGNGCEDDICQTVTVSGGTTPTCAAHFNFETEGLTAWFNGNPSEANGEIIGWQWNFGDGTSSGPDAGATVNHTYAEAGTYTVCLLIWTGNGCEDDICQTVVIEGPVSSNRLALPQNLTNSDIVTAEIDVINSQTARVLLTNSSGQRVQVQTIDLLEGQNEVSLNLQPLLPGLYFVTLELANGKTITQRLCRIE